MILQRRSKGLAGLHCALQASLVEILFTSWMALPITMIKDHRILGLWSYLAYNLVIVSSIILDGVWALSHSAPVLDLSPIELLRRTARQVVTVALAVSVLLVATKDISVSRIFLFSFFGGMSVLLGVTNWILPGLIAGCVFSTRHRQIAILASTGDSLGELEDWSLRKRAYGIDVAGRFDVAEPALIEQKLVESQARQLILMNLPENCESLTTYAAMCDRLGVRLLVRSDWQEKLGRTVHIVEDDGFQFFSFQRDALECPLNRTMKRAFDLLISIPICLFILPPLSIVVLILQYFQSRGPVFFLQKRTGVNGRDFWLIKFRTMTPDHGREEAQATLGDSRVFPAGRWLRRFSLDEIPQFLNVLSGEMSVVGPRPHMKAHDEQFAKVATGYRVRHFIKPGITGLAQVSGWRGETKTTVDVVKRTEADLAYVENWSLAMDTQIVARTAVQMLQPAKEAY